MKYPKDLHALIAILKKFPGVGAKTAERFAFHLLSWPKEDKQFLSNLLEAIQKSIIPCQECGALRDSSSCPFCVRFSPHLCIVSSPKDIYAVEETKIYQGLYYVLPRLLSPIEGKTLTDTDLHHLQQYIQSHQVKEVILALDSTLEGDTTSLFLKQHLAIWNIAITRLAFGLPVGSSLEYIDGTTLARALSARQIFL